MGIGNISIGAVGLSLLIRYLVGRFPHSGQNQAPIYGDYEAQRHWMEITTNLSPSEWYVNSTNNDLQYWGLDYPPLTAYHMFFCGLVSRVVNSTWTELGNISHGMDTYEHKLFMRATVLVSDILIFMPAIIYYFSSIHQNKDKLNTDSINAQQISDNLLLTIFALNYPAQILIDHGHFQYNCVFMGLVVWAIILMGKERFLSSSLIFSLALNYKQMSLYYSFPFFWYLLSVSVRRRSAWKAVGQLILISLTVITTFLICWSPFLNNVETALQVLHRLFPFDRGLFEDKVANIWCSLSVIIKFKQFYTIDQLLKLSTLLTLSVSLPSGLHLLVRPSFKAFRYSLINSSLIFFLTSFQVHEKTILVPAVPIILMFDQHLTTVNWFVLISTFSLQPLMAKDQLMIPYASLFTMYAIFSTECFRNSVFPDFSQRVNLQMIIRCTYAISLIGCILLSLAAVVIPPPDRYPDIHPTLNSIYSCAHFIGFLCFFYYQQFKCPAEYCLTATTNKRKSD